MLYLTDLNLKVQRGTSLKEQWGKKKSKVKIQKLPWQELANRFFVIKNSTELFSYF